MKFVFFNILRSVKCHPKENGLIVLNVILCTLTVYVLLQNYYFLKNRFDLIYSDDQVAQHYSIVMSDDDFQSMLSDILNHSPMFFVGNKVNKEIMNTPHLSLYYFNSVLVPLSCFKNKEQIEEYSFVNERLRDHQKSIDDEGEYNFINAVCVSENFDEVFHLNMYQGRFFEEDDRNTNDSAIPVPIVLGNDFAKSYEVGDVIEMEGDTAIVIGILDDNMYLSLWGYVEYLDDAMLTLCPYLPRQFDLSLNDYNYEKSQIYEWVYCDDPAVDVQKVINSITARNGYYTYEVQPVDGIEISETKSITAKNVALMGILALIACIMCVLSLSYIVYNRTNQDKSILCIYLCCGIPLWKYNVSIIIEMTIYLLISLSPTYALSIVEYGKLLVPIWFIVLFSGLIVFASLIPALKVNKDNHLNTLMNNIVY